MVEVSLGNVKVNLSYIDVSVTFLYFLLSSGSGKEQYEVTPHLQQCEFTCIPEYEKTMATGINTYKMKTSYEKNTTNWNGCP